MENQLTPWEEQPIRRVVHNGELWFSILDIIAFLTDTAHPSKYWNKVKTRMAEERGDQLSPFWGSLKLMAADGRQRATDCANTEGVLRLIMSIPSPKAEPLRQWLARVGQEQIEAAHNPEIALERTRDLYRAKGYSEDWIETRLQTITTRKDLTDEWQKRGVKEGQEYALLTAEVAKGTFGLSPNEHSQHKNIGTANLRDHMTKLELIFTMLSEETTRRYAEKDDAQGFMDNQEAARKGGVATGNARRSYEATTGETVVSTANFLGLKSGKEQEENQ